MGGSRFGKHEEEEDEEANWLDSYSDLITDLMAIFVVLFSFAMVNQAVVTYNIIHANDAVGMAQRSASKAIIMPNIS